ncbi:MAG: nitronate monooxygenase family protein [Dehalococcoidia bacterium]|nr:nitronate monooxygenase family protein [Dehalococcoidia bacterium]
MSTQNHKTPSLIVGDLEINPPIIQGGMGVRVSKANLAAAVANEGCVGVVSAVGLGPFEDHPGSEFVRLNELVLREELRKTKSLTDGIIGVNVMVVLSNFDNLTATAAEEGVDMIISGAGLPLDLPKFVEGKPTKLVPIVSSARALSIIYRKWKQHYGRAPDAVVVEGAKAGGHLGFGYEELLNGTAPTLDEILVDVIRVANAFDPPVPVVAAGGIFDGKDIARVLKMGASGVQIATRFVCTDECDVHESFKQAYLKARKEDLTIIKSPVGMPGRVINNEFVERIKRGETVPFKCTYKCLKSCNPKTAPYCIAKVLVRAAEGNLDEAFAFAGANAYRCTEIVPVKELIGQLAEETAYYLSKNAE